ncbi:MAG: DUF4118 domain-containing protein [Acidimicrobiales bacterium]
MKDRRGFRRFATGAGLSAALVAGAGAAMFPLRDQLTVATPALILVVPVVVGVVMGGFSAGVVATGTGFLVYDFLYIPPYYTLRVGQAQYWAALVVYALVTVLVARVVARLSAARAEAQFHAAELRRLFDLS